MKQLFAILSLLVTVSFLNAQTPAAIKLNTPDKTRGASVMQALTNRQSVREYADRALSLQDLSDLLWAANGINRPDGRRTAATASNKQDIDLYAILPDAAYLYDAREHALKPVAAGDFRPLVAGSQRFALQAPLHLVMVSDFSRLGGSEQSRRLWSALDAGIVSQNIALFCSGCGLGTVPRTSMQSDKLKEALKLTDTQFPLINNIVGYPKQAAATAQAGNFHNFKVRDINGDDLDLASFKGKKVLVVNVASKCGLTPQYTQLQALYKKYGPDKFAIVGFPANNFGKQEPGTDAEIKEFCSTKYSVTFPMMSKISVKGDDIHPLYAWLTQAAVNGKQDAPVTWNFQKFMIDENGNWAGMVPPRTLPDSEIITNWIEGRAAVIN
ncbi:MAG: nitroreductase family protein [Opitutaceae bacterium]|nr:nitroreductase family protein [Opitutaceae bacterium]